MFPRRFFSAAGMD